MDFDKAIHAHSEWKVKLRAAINKKESLDSKVIAMDNQCALGKWLYGEGKLLYGKTPAFLECVSKHAAFHRVAGQVAETITKGKGAGDASQLLEAGSPFNKASTAVAVAITTLKKSLGG